MKGTLWSASFLLYVTQALASSDYCSVQCQTTSKKKPVCASDRQSYPSKCEVRRQRICFGKKNLEWVHEGECRSTDRRESSAIPSMGVYSLPKPGLERNEFSGNCTAKRLLAIQDSQKLVSMSPGAQSSNASGSGIVIYRCKPDGRYEEVQCQNSTGYCWCVNPDTGVPIPQTSTQHARPQCESERGDSSSSDCDDSEKTVFNANLLSGFLEDYRRLSIDDQRKFTTGYDNIQGMTEENAKVAAWRFNSLDRNGDMRLTNHEVKELKRDIRKNIKPKGCAKQFLSYCDKDSDSLISFEEWNFCLGGDTHLSYSTFLSLSSMRPQDQLKWNGNILPIQDQSQSSESKDNGNPPELMEHQKKLFDMLSGESGNKEESSSRLRNADQYGGNDRIDRSPNDRALDNIKLVSLSTKTCMDERESALAKMNDQTFVPNCQADGRYEPTQCHSFSGYCWCVDPESGLPISGTSRLKENPECASISAQRIHDNLITNTKLGGKLREIPGCPSPNHGAFLRQLVDLLSIEMAAAGDLPDELTDSANMSLEEKAVRWKAITADRNNDQKLSKKEMRFVRHMVKEKRIKSPEKCAKKFMKYCDTDSDDYVNVEELLVCTEVRRQDRRNQRKQQSGGDNIRHSNNRNPFTDLLKPS
ncbi:SPARC-related modular calcium-binding protein 2-like isoform X2 [Watersipora subatra]|uniref:SPARC-related modular calcium-binding protein 2-like isoform X2 n=1 Tax=Watersipora subatra TaxID=2589382 RepID=UPI00355B74D0